MGRLANMYIQNMGVILHFIGFLMLIATFSNGQYVTLAGPSAVEQGIDTVFMCSGGEAPNVFSWEDVSVDPIVLIFNAGEAVTIPSEHPKYVNFNVAENEYTSTMTISNTLIEDQGRYRCTEGQTVDEAELNVEVGSASQPISLTSIDDDSYYQATCEAIGSSPEETITWILDGVTLSGGIVETDPQISNDSLFDKRSVFTFPATTENYKVQLECDISGHQVAKLNRRETRLLDIHKPPHPKGIMIGFTSDGTDLTVSCNTNDSVAAARPPIDYVYIYSNGTLVPKHVSNNTVIVTEPEQDTEFTCEGSNYLGNTTANKTFEPDRADFLDVRLVNGSNNASGRVEVSYNGTWGTVCDDGWDLNDANVICRMLGFFNASSAPGMAAYGAGYGEIHLDEVNCTGSESSLEDCIKSEFGVNNCEHSEDAGVTCGDSPPFQPHIWIPKTRIGADNLGVRLVNGSNNATGRVEVSYNGTWGTVCDDGWDLNDANVVCRMLGFFDASSAPGLAAYGAGSGKIHLDEVDCTGSESSLEDCISSEFGVNDCEHSEDAGVTCGDSPLFQPHIWIPRIEKPCSVPRNRGPVRQFVNGNATRPITSYYTPSTLPAGTQLVARCRDPGKYRLIGDQRRTCEGGRWTGEEPECQLVETQVLFYGAPLEVASNGTVVVYVHRGSPLNLNVLCRLTSLSLRPPRLTTPLVNDEDLPQWHRLYTHKIELSQISTAFSGMYTCSGSSSSHSVHVLFKEPPKNNGSCSNSCCTSSEYSCNPDGCYCDTWCENNDNCCDDYEDVCPSIDGRIDVIISNTTYNMRGGERIGLSSNRPQNYNNLEKILWHVRNVDGRQFLITFGPIRMHSTRDYVRIYTGISDVFEESTQIFHLTYHLPGDLPFGYWSVHPNMWLQFSTDAFGTDEGFFILISSVYRDCDGSRFQCTNGQCIRSSAVCDGLSDCVDSSDEYCS